MLSDVIGAPQVAAAAVLLQRIFEEMYSARNTRLLLAAGAHEAAGDYYPVVAISHLAWIASVFLIIAPGSTILLPLAAVYAALQMCRYWVIASLGRFWTHRIVTLDDAPVVTRGPYRWMRHPNYAVTIGETFLLPAVFGAWSLGLVMGAISVAVIRYKILLEDRALAERRQLNAAVSAMSVSREGQ